MAKRNTNGAMLRPEIARAKGTSFVNTGQNIRTPRARATNMVNEAEIIAPVGWKPFTMRVRTVAKSQMASIIVRLAAIRRALAIGDILDETSLMSCRTMT